jgi:muramoyltetrapeptide carboxypeptidase
MPRALRPGVRVAIVSPCGPVLDHDLLDRGIGLLRSWGLQVVEGRHARTSTGHLAGTDDQRVHDLNAAIADPDIRAVWVTRGGYGLTRILDRVDWPALAADPGVIVGFSDVSALLAAAWRRIGLITVHGPFVGRLAAEPREVRDQVRAVVFGGGHEPLAGAPMAGTPRQRVRAPLIGGNLSVLAALAGTPDQLDANGCVLLLEDVGEAPYRVDRLLTQLRQSGSLDGVLGVAVGSPVRCEPPPSRPSATFADVLGDRLGDLGVPVVTDLPIGHMAAQRAVLHGGEITIDSGEGSVATHARLPVTPVA